MRRHPDVRVERSTLCFRGRIFDVVQEALRLPSGLRQDLAIVEHSGAVCIAPVLPDGRLLLVRQYRHATGEWLVEIPAGRLEPREDPLDAARRELEEETGHRAGAWRRVCEFWPAPGFCSELLILYEARDLVPVAGGGRPCDDDEEIELVRHTPQELLAGIARDAKTLLAAHYLAAAAATR
jgi:ADP-ribose pyrophosphatase